MNAVLNALEAVESKNDAAYRLVSDIGEGKPWMRVAKPVIATVGIILVGAGANLLLSFMHESAIWILRLLLSMAVAALVWAIASRHRRQWVLPVEHLATLIREVRSGVAPSEELTEFQGSLQDVAEEVKTLLRDMRRQKQEIADLNDEVRQRIANRNSALERTINALRQQTVRDPLTGLFNQRALDQMLPALITGCREDHKPLATLMLDLEHFKEFTDALGHAAGDELLRSLGQIIHSTIREADAAFRGGADQFVVILPGCDAAFAQRVADRLQSLVSSMSATYRIAVKPALSIGICTLDDLGEPTAQSMLRRADERLRASKAA